MYQIDIMSRTPVYEQIVTQTERFVLTGILKPGDQLPSVRQLSLSLSLNPNTIQKAFTELERRGITVSAAGRGIFIRHDVAETATLYRDRLLNEFKIQAQTLKSYGLDQSAMEKALNEVFTNEGGFDQK